jgi:hypothetical protein
VSTDAAWNRRDRKAVKGRRCQFCQAEDTEVPFENAKTCEACAQAYHRKHCKTHKWPRVGVWGLCYKCPRPRYLVPVVLLDAGSDRERVVYRARGGPGERFIRFKERQYRVPKYDLDFQLVLTVPTKVWLRTKG